MIADFVIPKILKKILNPPSTRSCNIDKHAKICSGSELTNVSLGRYSYIGNRCFMVNVDIKKFCSIADRCSIGLAAHPINRVSSSPVFHEGKNIMKKNFANFPKITTPKTTIENDVWIGMGSYIKAGVTIHNGAVIGMGSVVTKDVPAYEIWAGCPARKIGERFDKDTADAIQNTEWWNWKDNKIDQYVRYFDNIEKFIENSNK